MGIFLWMVVGLSIIYLLSTPLEYFYEWIKGLKQYYTSDEYKEKVKLLKAKRMSEKLKRTDYKKYQKEELKKKIIESRNQKLSFELAKKPKESFLYRTETYSKEELVKKEKEWSEFSRKFEKNEIYSEKGKSEGNKSVNAEEKIERKVEDKPKTEKPTVEIKEPQKAKVEEQQKNEEKQAKVLETNEINKSSAENTKV